MEMQILHIYKNTPFGRELLLQTGYFCKTLNISPVVYVPEQTKFLMYFENDVVQIDLDKSYLRAPETAGDHVTDILASMGLQSPKFFVPRHFTASALPDVPVHFDFMTGPRVISNLSSKLGPGYIGPRIQRIVRSSRFPVLIPSCVFKPWKSIAVLFGGSANAVKAFRLGVHLGRLSGMPVALFTGEGRRKKSAYESMLAEQNLSAELERSVAAWHVFSKDAFEDNLYQVPHDALVVIGASGQGLVKELLFGSTLKMIQSVLPNNLLIVGPGYRAVN